MKTSLLTRSFALYFVAVLAITIITSGSITLIADEGFSTNVLGNVGSLLQGTLGTAVALAGAFVAIRVAALSYKIVDEEKQREDLLIISQTIESGLHPLINVTKVLREIYSAEIGAKGIKDEAIRRIAPNGLTNELLNAPLLDHERVHFARFSLALSKLADALEEVAINSYSAFIWQQVGLKKEFWLDKLNLDGAVNKVSVYHDPFEISGWLRERARIHHSKSISANLANIVEPKLFANGTKDQNNNQLNNASVRYFVEAGADIFCLKDSNGISNIGLAILHDICCCIPEKSSEIESALVSLFGEVTDHKLLMRIPLIAVTSKLGNLNWYGASFSYALSELRKISPRLTL